MSPFKAIREGVKKFGRPPSNARPSSPTTCSFLDSTPTPLFILSSLPCCVKQMVIQKNVIPHPSRDPHEGAEPYPGRCELAKSA